MVLNVVVKYEFKRNVGSRDMGKILGKKGSKWPEMGGGNILILKQKNGKYREF